MNIQARARACVRVRVCVRVLVCVAHGRICVRARLCCHAQRMHARTIAQRAQCMCTLCACACTCTCTCAHVCARAGWCVRDLCARHQKRVRKYAPTSHVHARTPRTHAKRARSKQKHCQGVGGGEGVVHTHAPRCARGRLSHRHAAGSKTAAAASHCAGAAAAGHAVAALACCDNVSVTRIQVAVAVQRIIVGIRAHWPGPQACGPTVTRKDRYRRRASGAAVSGVQASLSLRLTVWPWPRLSSSSRQRHRPACQWVGWAPRGVQHFPPRRRGLGARKWPVMIRVELPVSGVTTGHVGLRLRTRSRRLRNAPVT